MKHNLFLGVQPAPYRVDLCNWLYEQLDCDIYHLTPTGEDLAFDQAALKSSFRFDYKIYPKGSLPFLASLVKSHRPEDVSDLFPGRIHLRRQHGHDSRERLFKEAHLCA